MVKTRFRVGAGKCGMGMSAAKSQENVREFYIDWRVVTL